MFAWYQKVLTITSAVVLAIIGEVVAKYLTGDFIALRGAVLLSVTIGLALLLLVTLSRTQRRRIVLDFITLTTGLVSLMIGLLFTLPGQLPDPEQASVLRSSLIGLGLLESVLSIYSIFIGLSGRDVDFLPRLNMAHMHTQLFTDGDQKIAVTRAQHLRPEHEVVLFELRRHVSKEDLHYAAYYVNGECQFFVDALDNVELDKFFQDMERPTRRSYYERHGRQLIWLVSALDRSFSRIQGGMLVRTVLDVQYGALYHFPIAVGVDLIGVTLIQESVPETDAKLVAIRDELAVLPRGGKLGKPLRQSPFYLPAPSKQANVVPFTRREDRTTGLRVLHP